MVGQSFASVGIDIIFVETLTDTKDMGHFMEDSDEILLFCHFVTNSNIVQIQVNITKIRPRIFLNF